MNITDYDIYQYLSFRNVVAPQKENNAGSSLHMGEVASFDSHKAAEIISEAMQRILKYSDNIACFLSGGLDSSYVTALAASARPGITAFTLEMKDSVSVFHNKSSEINSAKLLVEKYDIHHEIITISVDDLINDLDDMLAAIGEPFSGTFSTWILAKEASKHFDTVLTGDGADELFAGYEPYKLAYDEDIYSVISKMLLMDDDSKALFVGPKLRQYSVKRATEKLVKERVKSLQSEDPLNKLLEFDAQILLPDHVLKYIGAFSGAFGIKIKSPYLDETLRSYITPLPGRIKINNGITKALLRKIASGTIPEAIVNRRKEGFVMPIEDWMASEKALKEFVIDTLTPTNILRYDYLDPVAVQMLLKTYFDAPYDNPALARIIWNFTCLHRWLGLQININ